MRDYTTPEVLLIFALVILVILVLVPLLIRNAHHAH